MGNTSDRVQEGVWGWGWGEQRGGGEELSRVSIMVCV